MTPASIAAVRLALSAARGWIDLDAELMHRRRRLIPPTSAVVHAAVYLWPAGRASSSPRSRSPCAAASRTPVSWPTPLAESLPRLVAPEAVTGQKRPLPT